MYMEHNYNAKLMFRLTFNNLWVIKCAKTSHENTRARAELK